MALRKVRAGEPITDQLWNEMVGEILRLKGITVASPLGMLKGQSGYHLYLTPTGAAEETHVFNNSSEEIPAYGCMAVTGVHTDANYLTVDKPSTTFRRQYLPNGPTPIPVAGKATIPSRRYTRWLYNSGTPTNDLGMGPTPGQWYLTANYPAVSEAVGIYDATAKVIWGTVHTIDKLIGKIATGSSLTPGGTATINVWDSAGPTIITSLNVTGKDWLMRAGRLTAGTKVILDFVNGTLFVAEASCGP